MARNRAPEWNQEDINKLMREYDKMGRQQLADELGRTLKAVTSRYYIELNKMYEARGIKQPTVRKPNSPICPQCGKKSRNEIVSIKNTSIISAWWCKSCMVEFFRGEVLPLMEQVRKKGVL